MEKITRTIQIRRGERARKRTEIAGKAELRVITMVLRNNSRKMKLTRCYWMANKGINTIQAVFANNHAYLMLTDFVDPS